MVTIKDVAKLANVSISTVSYALNNTGNVSEETKRKVLEASKKLNYKPSGIARSLKTKKTEIIGIFLNNFSGPIYSEIITGARDIAKVNGYDLVIAECTSTKNSLTKLFTNRIVDGAIILSADIDNQQIETYASKGFPIVVMDRELTTEYISSVVIDNQNAAYDAIKYIYRQGYKNIALINGPKGTYDSERRYEGYLEGMKDYNLVLKEQWNCIGDFEEKSGYEIVKKLIHMKSLPEVICAANDEMAIGAIKALQEKGIRVPEDIGVIGFDDIPMAEYINPKLTTIRRPTYDLGVLATHTLFNNIKGNLGGISKKLSTEFIIRESLL